MSLNFKPEFGNMQHVRALNIIKKLKVLRDMPKTSSRKKDILYLEQQLDAIIPPSKGVDSGSS